MIKNIFALKDYQPELLNLVDTLNSVLHKPAQKVTFPLSDHDKKIILNMIYSIHPDQLKAAKAPWDSAAGMAANQWGISKSIFLFCPHGQLESHLEIIINPRYQPRTTSNSNIIEEDLAWEGCFSIPLASGLIKRYCAITALYQNESGEEIVRELEGWEARVFQHETDHLMGHLYDDPSIEKCLDKKLFNSKEDYLKAGKQ